MNGFEEFIRYLGVLFTSYVCTYETLTAQAHDFTCVYYIYVCLFTYIYVS